MSRSLLEVFIVSSCFFFAMAGNSQTLSISQGNSFYSPDEYQAAHTIFNKTRNDLSQIVRTRQTVAAEQEVTALEQNWNQARYDSRQMANTIRELQSAINQPQLTSSDQNLLTADLSRLIEFQSEYY